MFAILAQWDENSWDLSERPEQDPWLPSRVLLRLLRLLLHSEGQQQRQRQPEQKEWDFGRVRRDGQRVEHDDKELDNLKAVVEEGETN